MAQTVSDSKLTFNPSSGILTATGFTGNLTGDITGNAATATTASTVTTNANLTGPITSVGNATTITNNAVTYGKMQAVSTTSKLLGSSDASTAVQEITLGTGITMTGSTISAAASTFADPSATIVLTATNGVATTAMRSDAAPALSQAIIPTWTGAHTWSALGTFNLGLNASGAAINLNNNSNFATNINTGSSTGTVTIGNSASSTTLGSVNNTIGIAGTANGNGVHLGNGRFTINKPVSPITGQTGTITPTVTQILDGGLFGFNSNAACTLTLPSAAGAGGLVQALPGTPAEGDIFTFLVYNDLNGSVSLGANTGVTLVTSITDATDRVRVVYCRVTSVAADSETISVY